MQFFYMISGTPYNVPGNKMKGYVPAIESRLSGYWHEGKPYLPDMAAMQALVPYRWRNAIARAQVWTSEDAARRFQSIHCDLYTARGKYIGTIYFQPESQS